MKWFRLFRMTALSGMIALVLSTAHGESAEAGLEARIPMIATVDMGVLCQKYFRTSEVQKQNALDRGRIQKEQNERRTNIRAMDDELATLRKQLEDSTPSESRKQTLFKQWQAVQQQRTALDHELSEFSQRRARALNETMIRRLKEIFGEVRVIVEEQAKRDGYDYVFDRSGQGASQGPLLLYSKDASDITASLVKRINRDAPPGGSEEENNRSAMESK